MVTVVATGIPAWPSPGHAPAGAFDWAPFLMVAAALLVAPVVFGIRLTIRSVGMLVLGGIVLGFLGNGIGSIPAVCLGLLVLALVSSWPGRSQGGRHGNILHLPD